MSRWLAVAPIVFALAQAAPAVAQDFRIDTQVFTGEEKTPEYQSVTLFQRDLVYDFLGSPTSEIAIYDARQRHFTLLDVERKIKTRITQEEIEDFVAAVQTRALQKGGPLMREAAQPRFDVQTAEDGRVALQGKRIEYVAVGASDFPNQSAADAYYRFIDVYTMLSATAAPMPPQARLKLNQALAQAKLMPSEITLTLRSGNALFGDELVKRSKHEVTWKLLRADQKMIDEAAADRANFIAVPFAQFRNLKPADE